MDSNDNERLDPSANSAARSARPGLAAGASVDTAVEEAHWRERHQSMPWHRPGLSYEDYRPAYELGWNRRLQSDLRFDGRENELAAEWEARRGQSPLDWPEARAASLAAWDRTDSVYFAHAKKVGMDEAFAFVAPLNEKASDSALQPVPRDEGAAKRDDDEIVSVLNHLLENARDGEQAYSMFVQQATAPELQQLFEERAAQCSEAARELLPLIGKHGGTPADGGSVRGALHRGWVQLKGALGSGGPESVLDECERAEDAAVDRYRSALQSDLPQDVRDIVERQAMETRRQHERIRELRDAMRTPP